MPTPAKLVAALLFAGLCWYTADLIFSVGMPEGSARTSFPVWFTLGGLLVGWVYIGKRVSGATNRGASIPYAVTAGLGGAIIIASLALVLNSFVTMITTSLNSTYTELGAAIDGWIGFFMQDLELVVHPEIIATFFGGALVVGLISGIIGRVWR